MDRLLVMVDSMVDRLHTDHSSDLVTSMLMMSFTMRWMMSVVPVVAVMVVTAGPVRPSCYICDEY